MNNKRESTDDKNSAQGEDSEKYNNKMRNASEVKEIFKANKQPVNLRQNTDGEDHIIGIAKRQTKQQDFSEIENRSSVEIDESNDHSMNQEYNMAPMFSNLDDLDQDEISEQLNEIRKSRRNQDEFINRQKIKYLAGSGKLRGCKEYNYFILLPDEKPYMIWDSFITIMLLADFVFTPIGLAFYGRHELKYVIPDTIFDLIFLVNIFLTFFMAYYDKSHLLVDKRKDIALEYLKFWLWVDIIALVPFYAFLPMKDINSLVRMLRLWNLKSRLKIKRILRSKEINISKDIENLIVRLISFILFWHMISCVWIIFGNFHSQDDDSWIVKFGVNREYNPKIYLISIYFVITTFSTEGYGDYTPNTSYERVLVIFMQLIGAVFFTVALSSLSTLIQQENEYNDELQKRLDRLDGMKRHFNMNIGLYDVTKQSLIYQHNINDIEAETTMRALPYSLRSELCICMIKSLLLKLFVKKDPDTFFKKVFPKLRAVSIKEGSYIYKEGEDANYIYFLLSGKAAYCLSVSTPYDSQDNRKHNLKESERLTPLMYIAIRPENHFGSEDLAANNNDIKSEYKRKFSIFAVSHCELVGIHKNHLHELEVMDQLMEHNGEKYLKMVNLKKRAVLKVLNTKQKAQIGVACPDRRIKALEYFNCLNEGLELHTPDSDNDSDEQLSKQEMSRSITKVNSSHINKEENESQEDDNSNDDSLEVNTPEIVSFNNKLDLLNKKIDTMQKKFESRIEKILQLVDE